MNERLPLVRRVLEQLQAAADAGRPWMEMTAVDQAAGVHATTPDEAVGERQLWGFLKREGLVESPKAPNMVRITAKGTAALITG